MYDIIQINATGNGIRPPTSIPVVVDLYISTGICRRLVIQPLQIDTTTILSSYFLLNTLIGLRTFGTYLFMVPTGRETSVQLHSQFQTLGKEFLGLSGGFTPCRHKAIFRARTHTVI